MQEKEGVREIMTTNHSNISATCPGEWPASRAAAKPDAGHIASCSFQGDSRFIDIPGTCFLHLSNATARSDRQCPFIIGVL